jgi:type III secretory pathway component EscS
MPLELAELCGQAWRVLVLIALPCLLAPVVGAVSSFLLGMLGVRDEGLGYGVRVVAMVVVISLVLRNSVDDLVRLMQLALQ